MSIRKIKVTEEERAEARAELRRLFAPGDTIAQALAHVSRDGMTRTVQVLAVDRYDYDHAGSGKRKGRTYIRNVSFLVAKVLDWQIDDRIGGVRVGGVGMDMAFALADSIGYALYRAESVQRELTRSQRAKVKAAYESRGNFMRGEYV